MPETAEPTEAMFPKLDQAQIARLLPLGQERRVAAGEIDLRPGRFRTRRIRRVGRQHRAGQLGEGPGNGPDGSRAWEVHRGSEPALGPPQPGAMPRAHRQQAARNQPCQPAACHAERRCPGRIVPACFHPAARLSDQQLGGRCGSDRIQQFRRHLALAWISFAQRPSFHLSRCRDRFRRPESSGSLRGPA